jgi:hypothetical protein
LNEDGASAAAVAASLRRRSDEALKISLLLTPAGRREAEARAREAERERRAALPPPRAVLREAHTRQAEAESEVMRLGDAVDRAREHRGIIASRRDEIAQTIEAGDDAAAARLIAELTSGSGRPVDNDLGEGIAVSATLTAADRELAVVDRALAQLEGQLAEVRIRRSAAAADVRRAACALLLRYAETRAERLQAMERAILEDRDALDALTRAITDAQRGETVRPIWPAQIGQAISPLEPLRAARATAEGLAYWVNALAGLTRDPEARPDLDAAETELPAPAN